MPLVTRHCWNIRLDARDESVARFDANIARPARRQKGGFKPEHGVPVASFLWRP
jgi:hypothetical protein